MSAAPHHRPVPVSRAIASASLVLGLLLLTACAKPLLSPEEDRTQYARYDALRNQYAPQYVEDEYGRQRPNLRARLSPKD